MKYLYNLTAYSNIGERKEISFGSNRLLREDAFLRLTVKPFRGVIKWEEISYEKLPVSVKIFYTDPSI